jgi:hypothetical protein
MYTGFSLVFLQLVAVVVAVVVVLLLLLLLLLPLLLVLPPGGSCVIVMCMLAVLFHPWRSLFSVSVMSSTGALCLPFCCPSYFLPLSFLFLSIYCGHTQAPWPAAERGSSDNAAAKHPHSGHLPGRRLHFLLVRRRRRDPPRAQQLQGGWVVG